MSKGYNHYRQKMLDNMKSVIKEAMNDGITDFGTLDDLCNAGSDDDICDIIHEAADESGIKITTDQSSGGFFGFPDR